MAQLRESAVTKLATVTGINAKSTGSTELYVVPTGKSLIVCFFVIRITSYTAGSKTVHVIASTGGNATSYNDYLSSVTYTVNAADKFIIDNVLDTVIPIYPAGTSFRINIGTGSNATTETWAVDLFGYLI